MKARGATRLAGLLLVPFLLAMGGGGGSGGPTSDSIPRPQEKHSAELLDRAGVATKVSTFSCSGRTFLPLDRGEGTLMVPFSKALRVKIGAEKGNFLEASILVEGGKSLDGRLPRTLLCTGATEYGNYQVELRGLKEIQFLKP